MDIQQLYKRVFKNSWCGEKKHGQIGDKVIVVLQKCYNTENFYTESKMMRGIVYGLKAV